MSDIAIHVEGLGKRYRIGARQQRATSLRAALGRALASPLDCLARVLRPPSDDEIVWALKDVSFDVRHGEVIGVIGRNGAGKSTLLKILSRITEPTTGFADINGRVGSLLEIGTGFHPELTGRENIYLNGAILGMSRAEIDRKFDEMVAFSGVEKFIDTPVKRYSSGMYVRLAFAVAAHLEPEILLVDEVLAVGDVAFQQKCLGKMGDVAREGRTVLFVSHNMSAITQLCTWGLMLEEGRVYTSGAISTVTETYLTRGATRTSLCQFEDQPDKPMQITSLSIENLEGHPIDFHDYTQPMVIRVGYCVRKWVPGTYVTAAITTTGGVHVLWTADAQDRNDLFKEKKPGRYEARIQVPANTLAPGRYTGTAAIVTVRDRTALDLREEAVMLDVTDSTSLPGALGIKYPSVTAIPLTWEVRRVG